MTWTADTELLNQTLTLGLEACQELQGVFAKGQVPAVDSEDFENLLLLCQAAGTLYYLGEELQVTKWPLVDYSPVLEAALAKWSADELHRAYVHFLQLARQLPAASVPQENADEGLRVALFEEVVACLRERDRVQLALRGATVLTQRPLDLNEELEDLLAIFDNELRECLHFLIPMNTRRQHRVCWARPDRLTDFWWWEQGFELPQEELRSLFQASEIVRRFPGARAFFEQLCESGEQLDRLLRLPPPG